MDLYNIVFYGLALIIMTVFAVGISYSAYSLIRDDIRKEKQKKLENK